MKVKVLCFGITRDILGAFENTIELPEGANVLDLKNQLMQTYSDFHKLSSLQIAVNEEYGDDKQILTEKDEVVLIPPVSGG
ncbi:MAG: MoaD/ThiS family protein [Cytophagales bacterium]|mgnify:CR=1 FL=1|nr:MoaD/ThiS family protein [Cytophagales bacterium]